MASKASNSDDKQEEPPKPPDGWDRCQAYITQKRRFCRQRPYGSLIYCGNHQHMSADNNEDDKNKRKRIPCPIDPSHLVYEDMVEKHKHVCPYAKRRRSQEEQAYYQENVNTGGHGSMGETSIPTDSSEWAKRVALRVLAVHQQLFGGEKEPASITLEDLHQAIPLHDLSQPELDAGLLEGVQAYRIKSGGARHLPQLASLIGHLRDIDIIAKQGETSESEDELVLLEMGAGRGMFGLTAAGVASAANQKVRLTMVERGVSRSKADTVLRNLPKNPESSYLKLEDVKWSRLVCDLAHVNLPTVMEEDLKGKRIVVIAKHLCGAGTDLALKSIDPIKEDVSACVLATCCHGVCTWKDYVGRDYLTEAMECDKLSFGSAEFDLLRRWSAGTVSSVEDKTATNHNAQPQHRDPADAEVEHTVCDDFKDSDPSQGNLYISAVVQHLGLICGIQGLGRACQRLIDHGRREYLRKVIFAKKNGAHKLIYYVPAEVTPQNALLLSHEEY